MGDGTRLAIAILVFWIALVFFFFAFHPGGVSLNGANISNPSQMLKFLMGEFSNLAGAGTSTNGGGGGGKIVAAADVTGGNPLNYPGYTTGTSDIPQGATLA